MSGWKPCRVSFLIEAMQGKKLSLNDKFDKRENIYIYFYSLSLRLKSFLIEAMHGRKKSPNEKVDGS